MARRGAKRFQTVFAGLIVAALVLGRTFAHRLPPDGVLRTWVGPVVALLGCGVLASVASLAGWHLWRGTGSDPYARSILPPAVTDRLSLAMPAMAVACWGLLLAGLIGAIFIPDDSSSDMRFVGDVGEAVLLVVAVLAVGTFGSFAFFAFTASRWQWPRFVLPAAERHRRPTDRGQPS